MDLLGRLQAPPSSKFVSNPAQDARDKCVSKRNNLSPVTSKVLDELPCRRLAQRCVRQTFNTLDDLREQRIIAPGPDAPRRSRALAFGQGDGGRHPASLEESTWGRAAGVT